MHRNQSRHSEPLRLSADKILGFVFCLVTSPMAWSGPVFDPPDLNLEYQMHRAFQTGLAPSTLAEDDEGRIESYRLQKGETLWGLSHMLYGDGNFWPKVWAQNRSITNPHLLNPGHSLQILLGSEDEAPAFRFSEGDDAGVELAASVIEESEIEIPEPEVPPRPIIRIPNSFPAWQEVYRRDNNELIVDDSGLKAKYAVVPDRIILDGFVQDKPLESVGQFLENENESGLPTPMQYVYVKVKKGTGSVGQKLLIVKDHGQLRKHNKKLADDFTAHFIEVFGGLELTESTPGSFKKPKDQADFDIYRALILQAHNLALSDYDLIPGEVQIVDMKDVGPLGSSQAQIVGSSKDKASTLFGPGEIVFLNKGTSSGVEKGQLLDIYMDRSLRNASTPVGVSSRSSGRVKVVASDGNCATAVVLRAVDGILQGDKLQSSVQSARLAPADDNRATEPGDLPDVPEDDLVEDIEVDEEEGELSE